MRKEIIDVDKAKGIMRVTTADERWYMKSVENPITKLPEWKFVPSTTWITGCWPKGIGFYKWLADKGWDEAEAIKSSAGDKGSKVHMAISAILRGEEVRIDSKFVNPSTGQEEELKVDEIECIQSFMDWKRSLKEFRPVAWDITLFSEKHNFAGSVDLVAYVDGLLYLIDFKTSQYIWTEYELQVSAYKQLIINGENEILFENKALDLSKGMQLGILQIGYKKNKAFWKWNEIEDAWDDFLIAQGIWRKEHANESPKQRDFPVVLSPATKPVVVSAPEEVAMDMEVAVDSDWGEVEATPEPVKRLKKKKW